MMRWRWRHDEVEVEVRQCKVGKVEVRHGG